MDRRLHQRPDGRNYVAEFALNKWLNAYLITRAGCILDLVHPKETGHYRSLIKDISIPASKGIKELFIIGHENCAAYPNYKLRMDEVDQHVLDVRRAREIIHSEFPKLDIYPHFAELEIGTKDIFIIKAA